MTKEQTASYYRAVRAGSESKVRDFLDAGMDPNAKTQAGLPVLHMATSPPVIRILVQAGASLEARDQKDGLSALEAACNVHLDAVRTLIELGADVNAVHDRGYSTLMAAVGLGKRRSPEIVQTLIDNGADPHHISDLGYNTIHAWCEAHNDAAPERESEEILKVLLGQGIDIDAREGRGFTPLLLALSYGNSKQAMCLLRNGANPHLPVVHPEGQGYLHLSTPLLLAYNSPELIQALLERGVDLQATDDQGNTALDLAQMELQGRELEDEEEFPEREELKRSIALLEKAMA